MAAPYSWLTGALSAKAEGTEGSPEGLADADSALQVIDPTWDPDVPFERREVISPSAGSFRGTVGGPRIASIGFTIPGHGSGSAGTPPSWGLFLQACGFSEDIVGGTSVEYKQQPTSQVVTMALNIDGLEHKIHGARAKSVTIRLNNGLIIHYTFEFMGVFNVPTKVTAPTPTYESPNPEANSGGAMTLDSREVLYENFELVVTNELEPRPSSRKAQSAFSMHHGMGVITGSIDPETEDPTTYDFFQKFLDNTEMPLSLVVGAAAGNKHTIVGDKIQPTGAKAGKRGHTHVTEYEFQANRTTGNDPISILLE